MELDFRNLNTLWASVLVETLYRCGLRTAIVCPGSRSAPLTIAFAQHPQIEAIPVLDERSASFFALGIAKQTHRPVALVCTSGTAGANFYPAVIEAYESRVPLLVLTADRPPELRDCNAGQAIDQQKLYGTFPNFYTELAIPELNLGLLQYLRQRIAQCYQQCLYPKQGVVHINVPLREPLAPIVDSQTQAFADTFPIDFFDHLAIHTNQTITTLTPSIVETIEQWVGKRGIIIAGVAQPSNPEAYAAAIARISKVFGFPVLAEAISPVRNWENSHIISTYDAILRHAEQAEFLQPELVIRVGEMPTSKVLRQFLDHTQAETWIIDDRDRSLDPLHGKTRHLLTSIETIAHGLDHLAIATDLTDCHHWFDAEAQTRSLMDHAMSQESKLFEGKVAWLLSQVLPPNTPLFVANSMPVRDLEYFWKPGDRKIQPYINRGANGIDGTLSTALGIAHRNRSSVMLTGDLSLLHDTNGFLLRRYLRSSLTIVLINNEGGGIFGMLPVANFDPPFEEFFSTPQHINFADLCQTYQIDYELMTNWEMLEHRLTQLPETGIRVLEVRCDRSYDAAWRKTNLPRFAQPAP
jgi:2-succinyl-5-enolpyruvyl-6-hydroxy-3-cyclohexene-1-carboxylate synthase